METKHLSMLGYREDGQAVAHCLEMDIRAYGNTFEQAFATLVDMVEGQIEITFKHDGNFDTLDRPASSHLFSIFQKGLKALSQHKAIDSNYQYMLKPFYQGLSGGQQQNL